MKTLQTPKDILTRYRIVPKSNTRNGTEKRIRSLKFRMRKLGKATHETLELLFALEKAEDRTCKLLEDSEERLNEIMEQSRI